MEYNCYDARVQELRDIARDRRRNAEVREIIMMAAEDLARANMELKEARAETKRVKGLIRDVFRVGYEMKKIFEE